VTTEPANRPALDQTAVAAPGWRVEVVAESPSTNADVTARALSGEPPGLVVVAEHQTAGRGRLDRVWVTPPRAALTFSALLAPEGVPLERWPWLPLLSGLAVLDGVRRVTGVAATLKWPNDVLVGDRKVAGILVQRLERAGGPVAIVGVGLNVSSTRAELPVPTATSLELAGAAAVDRTALLGAVLDAFTTRYGAWRAERGQGLRASYVAACSTVGRAVRVELPGEGPLDGLAVGVDAEGRLEVDVGTRVRALAAGDVVHVRPAAQPGMT
jgi:BirA family transcriptional regulator, biotin operon repressor / biotin---[acetyl-CoA-carboxylase] ligase